LYDRKALNKGTCRKQNHHGLFAYQGAMRVRKTRSAGGIDLLSVDLDIDSWTRLITGALEQGVIMLPESGI